MGILNNSVIRRCGDKIIGKKNQNKVMEKSQHKDGTIKDKIKEWLQNNNAQIKKSPQKLN